MSKGLEALETIKKGYCHKCNACCKTCSITTLEQELKALEAISQLFDIKYFIEEWHKRGVLPQEEYELLKEVLKEAFNKWLYQEKYNH